MSKTNFHLIVALIFSTLSFAATGDDYKTTEITVKLPGATVAELEANATKWVSKLKEQIFENACSRKQSDAGKMKCDLAAKSCTIKIETRYCQIIPTKDTCEFGKPRLAKAPLLPDFKICKIQDIRDGKPVTQSPNPGDSAAGE